MFINSRIVNILLKNINKKFIQKSLVILITMKKPLRLHKCFYCAALRSKERRRCAVSSSAQIACYCRFYPAYCVVSMLMQQWDGVIYDLVDLLPHCSRDQKMPLIYIVLGFRWYEVKEKPPPLMYAADNVLSFVDVLLFSNCAVVIFLFLNCVVESSILYSFVL